MLFKEFYKAQLGMDGFNPRHRKALLGNSDGEKKHLNTVAARHVKDNTKNHKIELLKVRPGRFICDPKDLAYIQQTFLKNISTDVFSYKDKLINTIENKLNIILQHKDINTIKFVP